VVVEESYVAEEPAFRVLLQLAARGVGFAVPALAETPYPIESRSASSRRTPRAAATTAVARFLGPKLTESWGQQVIVDNRPGGNTIIGTQTLARSTPDGYTIILTTNAHVINPSLIPRLPYDPIKDFAPVGNVYRSEFVLVITPSLPATTCRNSLRWRNPGRDNSTTPRRAQADRAIWPTN
jgi:hypothetical protein